MPINEDKCELPTRSIIFLGVELSTECPFCIAGVDETRVHHVLESIDPLMRSSTVSARKAEAVLGLLTFVSHVIWGSRLFLKSAYVSLRAAHTRRGVRGFVTLSRNTLLDLKWWSRMVKSHHTRRLVLGIVLPVSILLITIVAAESWGMGGFYGQECGSWFAISWNEIHAMRPHPLFPFRCDPSSHINILELFRCLLQHQEVG